MMTVEKLDVIKDRAEMMSKARSFFHKRGVIEVDCPMLSLSASVDVHINLIRAYGTNTPTRYLHSSPEYAMKRLLSEGIGDIYQLAHVFRDSEIGMRHNPEFTLAEWYRVGMSFNELIKETIDFVQLFVGHVPHETITYREAFLKYAGMDYLTVPKKKLIQFLEENGIDVYDNIEAEGRDGLLNIIMGVVIQPLLGQDRICVLNYFPASQAALAQTTRINGEHVSERFEVFYKGLELANGYHELTDPEEQKKRLVEANLVRENLGKDTLPIDEQFLDALRNGLPDCCGVAVGFDRLMMLRLDKEDIADVLPLVEL